MSEQATPKERQRVTDLYNELYEAVDGILDRTRHEDKWTFEYERILTGLQRIERYVTDIDKYA